MGKLYMDVIQRELADGTYKSPKLRTRRQRWKADEADV
jgi:hypothetical protein